MKSNAVIRAVVVALLTGAVAAHAATNDEKAKATSSTLPAGVATYGQLDELRSQAALAEAREKLNAGKPASSSAPARQADMLASPAAAPAPAPAAKASPAAAPVIHAEVNLVASDKDGHLYAVLNLQDGRTMPVRPGMTVSGLGVIKSISISEVVAEGKQGKQTVLPFANEAAAAAASAGAGAGMMGAGPMSAPGLSTVMPPIPAMTRGGR